MMERQKSDVKLVLVGKTGTGKTALANYILGRPAFESRVSASSVTLYPQESTTEMRFGQVSCRLVVRDTPGYDVKVKASTPNINNWLGMEPERNDNRAALTSLVIVLVTSVGDDPRYLEDIIRMLKTKLGRTIMQSVVVVFTRANNLKLYDDIDIGKPEGYIESFPQSLQNDIRQYVFIDSDADDLDEKLQELMDIVLRIHNRKKHPYALRSRTSPVPFKK